MSTLEFYAERAAQCRREADAAGLPNVRDRCLGAAEAWENMASRARKLQGFRADRAAEKAALDIDVDVFPEAATAILA